MTAAPTNETITAERVLSATVEAAERGERLDRLLARRFGDLSRTRLKHLVEAGRVSVDGATIKDPSLRVKPGQRCELTVPAPVADAPEAQSMALDIRYEDAELIVLEKPAGLVVHPAPGNPDRTLVNALLAHCGESLAGIGGVRRPGIVHRLDKDTSGLMVVAKTERAHAALAADFAARRIERNYLGVTWGVPQPREGEISGAIGRNPANRKTMAVVSRGGRSAITRYAVQRIFKDVAALVQCRLATGRTHQIRVHLAAHGNPLIGDPVYGRSRGRRRALTPPLKTVLESFPRQALHAASLGLKHPASGEWLQFQSELPSDMKELITILERV
ncbi:MAG TPA: RluA family pseudouridine synthase [Stellaceae bacterium]|nr:RluA family pseudouridine synthase [Stellaceae bacterium]